MIKFLDEMDETDYDFLCSILEDIDVSDEYPLYKSDDKLILWLVKEANERRVYFTMRHYVNKNTGELFKTEAPIEYISAPEYPYVNNDGWSMIAEGLYNTLQLVYDYGYANGADGAWVR